MKKIFMFVVALAAVLALCTVSVFAAEASVDGNECATIADAFKMAENGSTITLNADVDATSLLSVKSGISLTLDLNGHTITAVEGRYFIISIENGASLTVNDATNVGGIVNNNVQGYALHNLGTLVVNGGRFVGDYALYNGSYTSNTANATLNGGTFSANDNAFYSIANCSNLTISGATVNGWLSTSANFVMTSGSVENLYAGTPDAEVASGTATAINGGTVSALIFTEENTVTVENATIISSDAVATVNGKCYTSLQAALNAAKNGETVKLLGNIELDGSISVPASTNAVLDLAGYTISQSVECTASYQMILNNGTLLITDSIGGGKISFTDTGVGDSSAGWGSYTITNRGTLVVENVTVENLSAQNVAGQAFKHTSLAIFQYSGSCTINSGTISTPSYRSLRLWKGDVTINGGTFIGQVWVHCVDSSAELTINGGTFGPSWNDGSSVFVNNTNNDVKYDVAFSITDGTFNTKVGCSDSAALADSITGGTFSASAIAAMGTGSVLFAYQPSMNENGTYSVVPSLSDAFTFLGYSVNTEKTAISAGYKVDHEIIAIYCEQNQIESFNFGCAFGIDSIVESTAISFTGYSEYSSFSVKIRNIDPSNPSHINAQLAMAMYVDLGQGKQYVVEVDNAIAFVGANEVPTVTFGSYIG